MNTTAYDAQLFSELFDVQPQAIAWLMPVWDDAREHIIDFDLSYCNEEGLRYLNLTQEQKQGLRFSMLPALTEELRTKFFAEMVQVYQTGQKVESNVFNPILNKHARILRTRLRGGVLTVVQDRTEESRVIKQLEEQTQQLQVHKNLLDNLLRHSPAGISITQVIRDETGNIVDGRMVLANDSAIEYVGMPREVYLQKTVREADPAIFDSPLFQMALATLTTGKPFYTQYFLEPSSRWLELSVAKMDNDHLINIFMDVTVSKEAQLRQQKLLDELQRSNANLEEFAYAASHDLKEPIRKVLFFSERLKDRLDGRLDEEDLRMFGRLEAANLRMGALVDDLLAYSQVGQRQHSLQEVDLNQLVQVILDDLELEIEEKGAKVAITNLPIVNGHQRQLQQLFQNLISNALKYNKPGMSPEIGICCRSIRGQETGLMFSAEEMGKLFYLIEVTDNGIGFEQKEAERIFNVFQRLHGNKEYRGTGVGLAIARKVVQNHGGYITAESSPGEGATFRVYLPQEQNK